MTQEIYINNLAEILRNKTKLEEELQVKLENKGRLVFIEGNADDEYLCLRILEAVNLGFSVEKALLLKNEDTILHILNIKDVTKRKDFFHIKARLIGTKGKTKNNIEKLSDCLISIHDSYVGIIGDSYCIDEAIIAAKSLIQGSKQGNVYARLEKKKKERRIKPVGIIKNEMKKKEE